MLPLGPASGTLARMSRATPTMDTTACGPWYAEEAGFFGTNFLEEYANWMDPVETADQVRFLAGHASKCGSRILDVGCGNGRHLEGLTQQGFWAVGIDLNRGMIQRGAVVLADMRRIPFVNAFDTAFSWFSTFGYFSDERNSSVLLEVARSLRPGGRFIIDGLNADFIRRRYGQRPQSETVRCRDGSERRHDRWFDPVGSRFHHRRSRRGTAWSSDVRVYSPDELVRVTRTAGFHTVAMYGGCREESLSAESPRLVYVGEIHA